MAWVSLDDRFPEHRKNSGLSDAAFRLHISAICYCNRELSDGVIEAGEVPRLVRRFRRSSLDELVERGHWLPMLDGAYYQLHDYLDWNPSKERVMSRRRAAADRKAASRKRRR